MANAGDDYTKIFKWEIDNVLSLQQPNGEYVESEIFTTKGPYGQQGVKWVMRLYPRGEEDVKSKNNVSVFLVLLDGNGSKYVRAEWKLAIINEKGNKVNETEAKSYLFDLEDDSEVSWGKLSFITRSNLANANKNYIVDGHKLILQSEISVKVEKDLQADLMEKTELIKSLKRKLETKEAENGMIRSDYQQCQKRSREDNEKFEKEKANFEKYQKEAETNSKLLRKYANQLRIEVEKLNKNKLDALEKFNKLQGKYEKLSNYVRNSSKLFEEIENDDQDNSVESPKSVKFAGNLVGY